MQGGIPRFMIFLLVTFQYRVYDAKFYLRINPIKTDTLERNSD
jgi:hypothetical protein